MAEVAQFCYCICGSIPGRKNDYIVKFEVAVDNVTQMKCCNSGRDIPNEYGLCMDAFTTGALQPGP